MNKIYVTASEIGDYVYCKHEWWLKFKGINNFTTRAMEEGIVKHNSLFDSLRLNAIGIRIILIALGIAIFALILLLGVVFTF